MRLCKPVLGVRRNRVRYPGMRARFVTLSLIAHVILAIASPCAAQPAKSDPLPVEEIAPGLFVHFGAIATMLPENQGMTANSGFIVGSDAVAIIDPGGTVVGARRLLAAVRSRTDKPIRFVINTHMHPDHVFGNAAFEGENPTFVGHRNLPRAMTARWAHYVQAFTRILGDALMADVKLIVPSFLVENETLLDLGGRVLALKAWAAAHTDNDVTILDQTSGVLFGGDLVFAGHIPVLDGSIRGWLNVIQDLRRYQATRAVPGHGLIGEWPQALNDQQRYLQGLSGELRQLIARGDTLRDAVEIAGQNERSRWKLFDAYHLRNATSAFAELEWE